MTRGPDWQYTGRERPPFAETPGPGEESVWDYPRPPAVVADGRAVSVATGARVIAASRRCLRVLETAGPPTFYVPREDIDMTALTEAAGSSWCEWKGTARYFALAGAAAPEIVAWDYPDPNAAYGVLRDHLAFYPGRVACHVDGERVRAQAGGFYGGWITHEIRGPMKGEPGTGHW